MLCHGNGGHFRFDVTHTLPWHAYKTGPVFCKNCVFDQFNKWLFMLHIDVGNTRVKQGLYLPMHACSC